ncbi:NAD-dependent epimerase/dehydratase family protein [Solidesulfovibrio sp. C21]|uniref:NAD-dependent epimerase/dehydratase family protein n=1 Tax=Solidesulfovibrio sp. C21 TaxID=3398613 RepID=UPI0039FCF6E1
MEDSRIACLVTGCAGFIGSHLAERLLARGCSVIGVDNLATGHRRNMAAFAEHPDFTFFERDVCAPGLVAKARTVCPRLSHVFHLAAVVSVPYSVDHPRHTMAVNLDASVSLHEAAREAGLRAFVFAGSAAEYGETATVPIVEGAAGPDTVQQSPYGRAKFLASARIAASGFGVSLRCFNVYGPRQSASSPYSGVISLFMERGLCGRPLTIFGDGGQTRDFVAVSDVVEGYLLAAGLTGPTETPLAGIFNVGTGHSTSILELARLVAKLTGNDREPEFLSSRQGDIRHSVADFSKFAAAGFSPNLSLEKGLAILLDWQRLQKG